MAGFGIGGFGIGEFGIGGLTTGVGSLTTSTKQVVWRSDMIVTAGFTAIFDATYQVTVHTDCQSAVGSSGLTIASDNVILLTGTPIVANAGTTSLSIASSAVNYTSAPLLQPSLTHLTLSPLPTTITGTANLYPSAVALATNTEQVSTVIDQIITTQLGGQASQSFQVSTILDHNLSVGVTSLTIAEQAADVVTDVKVFPNASSFGIKAADQTIELAITVAASGGINVFYVDGVAKPTLALIKGNKYIFDQSNNTNSGHPLRFKDNAGNSFSSGVVATGTPGQAGAKVEFTVSSNTPSSLRYYCTVHGNGMGNAITVSEGSGGGYQVSTITDQNIPVGFTSLFDAEYQVSLVIGNTVDTSLGTLTITGKQSNLRIGNTIPLNLGSYQFTTLAPLPLTGSFEPAGRTIAPQRQSRQLVASFLSADGNDLVVTQIAQEQSRKISQQVNDQNGNDVQRVA
jgi:hypothetical protein